MGVGIRSELEVTRYVVRKGDVDCNTILVASSSIGDNDFFINRTGAEKQEDLRRSDLQFYCMHA